MIGRGRHSGRVPVLDHDALRTRAAGAAAPRFPGAELRDLRRLQGGLSGLTFACRLVHDGGRAEIVLKVAPPGLAPVRNRDVLRQAQVLEALAGLPGFPVPAVLFREPGAPPEVPPLFGMEFAPGDSYEPMLDVTARPPAPEVCAERMRVAARALAALHAAPPSALGLQDVPVVGLDEECARWARLLETIDPDICTGHEELARRLRERVPAGRPARVHHGDYRVANMLFVDATLSAVIDWEIWSLGDPRWDLAWLLMHTAPPHLFHRVRPAPDRAAGSLVPGPEALVGEYVGVGREAGAVGAEVDAATADLAWFTAACLYKSVSVIAALYKRERQLPEPDLKLVLAGTHLDGVLDAGHRALDRWS